MSSGGQALHEWGKQRAGAKEINKALLTGEGKMK